MLSLGIYGERGCRKINQVKHLYLKAWAEICKSKKLGGLGIRNPEAVNKINVG